MSRGGCFLVSTTYAIAIARSSAQLTARSGSPQAPRCCSGSNWIPVSTSRHQQRAGEGGAEEAEEGAEGARRRVRSSSESRSSVMSNTSESASVAQVEAGGREAARAAAAAADGAGEANGGGKGRGGVQEGDGKKAAQNGVSGGGGEMANSEDASHGFARPEMHSEALVGTVQYFERHVFLCCKGPESWPAAVEAASEHFDRLPNRLAAALKARKNDMPLKTRLTVCDEEEGPDSSGAGDVLIFPDMVRYKGLTDVDVDEFVEGVLVGGKDWKRPGSGSEALSGSYIFVCSHGSRDKRCGSCGPVLIEKLKEEIRVRGLGDRIFVRACSHVGGHKYAGNVIVFSSSGDGAAVAGHWYGYVSPADVGPILDQHIGGGEIIERLWRGQMGVSEGDQKVAQQSRLEVERNSSCCQSSGAEQANGGNQCGGGGSGCCQSVSDRAVTEVKDKRIPDFLVSAGSSVHDGHLIFPEDEDTDDEPTTDPRIPLWGNYYIPLPKWVQTWEKEDTNAALSVVGAAAAVLIAVRLWKETSASSSSS